MNRLLRAIFILLTSIILINCSYDIVDESKPSLIASMNNPDDEPYSEAFQNNAMLDSQTPTFVWTHIKKATKYKLIIYNMIDDEEFSFTAKREEDLEDVEIDDLLYFTIPTEEALALSKEKDGDLIPYRWLIVAKRWSL